MRRSFSKSSGAFLAMGLAMVVLPALDVHGESSLKTRAPTKSKEYDRNDNGKVDSYSENFDLGTGLTLHTLERLNEDTRAVEVRVSMILLNDQDLWSESWNSSLRERSFTVSRNSPFDVGMNDSTRSGEATVTLLGDQPRLVAILVRQKNGRYAPVMDEELARQEKMVQAVTDFALGVLDRTDELKEDKDEADKLIRKLDRVVDEYNQGVGNSTESSNVSDNKTKEAE